MNRTLHRQGTPALKWRHFNYIGDSAMTSMQSLLSDLLALSDSFIISGAIVSETPSGADTIVAITAGHVCFNGEPMPVAAHNITKSPTQEVYLVVEDIGVDVTPVYNLDGNQDEVMRSRRAKLAVGGIIPTDSMPIDSPRKEALEQLRYKGRLTPTGTILPYGGTLDHFNGTGLGLEGTPLEGWAICNGLNGTVDMRGLVPIGATSVPSSGAGAVNGAVSGSSSPGDVVGTDLKVIEAGNLPEHTHDQTILNVGGSGGDVQAGSQYVRSNIVVASQPNVTPNDPFSVKQASRSLVFIQSII